MTLVGYIASALQINARDQQNNVHEKKLKTMCDTHAI